MKIRKFKTEDLVQAANLIYNTYKISNNKEGSKKAVQAYLDMYDYGKNSQKINESFKKTKIFLVAEEKNKIIGVLRADSSRVFNLFVRAAMHKKGIGRALMQKFEGIAKMQGSKKVNIRSSLFAIPFYQNQGYKKTTGIRKSARLFNLSYQPMAKELK